MKALIFTLLAIGFISSCNHHTPPTFQDNHHTYKATVIDPDFSGVAYFNSIDQYLAWGTDAVIQRSGNGQNWKQADVLDNTFTQDINKIVEKKIEMSTYSYSKTRKSEMSLFSFFSNNYYLNAVFGFIWGQSKNSYLALKQIMLIFGLKFYCIPCS